MAVPFSVGARRRLAERDGAAFKLRGRGTHRATPSSCAALARTMRRRVGARRAGVARTDPSGQALQQATDCATATDRTRKIVAHGTFELIEVLGVVELHRRSSSTCQSALGGGGVRRTRQVRNIARTDL